MFDIDISVCPLCGGTLRVIAGVLDAGSIECYALSPYAARFENNPGGMDVAEAKVVKKVNAPAADVWAQLSVFDGIKPGGPIEAVRYEGEGVGMVRYLTMGGGQVVERLTEHDDSRMTFTYAIINEDCPLPFSNYSATVSITDDGDGTSTVDWTGTFDPKGDETAAINMATGIYAGGIKGAMVALGVD